MNTGTLNSLALNSVPASGGGQKTYTTDFRAVSVQTKTYTTDFLAQATFSKTYTTDFVALGGSTKFYSTDFVAVTPYKDFGSYVQGIGNNLSVPIEPTLGVWSTYSRPTVTRYRIVYGINIQTGKFEYWNPIAGAWKVYDGTAAP